MSSASIFHWLRVSKTQLLRASEHFHGCELQGHPFSRRDLPHIAHSNACARTATQHWCGYCVYSPLPIVTHPSYCSHFCGIFFASTMIMMGYAAVKRNAPILYPGE